MKKLFFVSTNTIWGGSEVLWSEAAAVMADEGYAIIFGTRYSKPDMVLVSGKKGLFVDLKPQKSTLLKRVISKLLNLPVNDVFTKVLTVQRPDLVIITQGNNVDGNGYMKACIQLKTPYITLTQLVTEVLWISLNDTVIEDLTRNYQHALMNYFVSRKNLLLHQKMMGHKLTNYDFVLNPFSVPFNITYTFPGLINNCYQIALVARLDIYHKGHDLLIEIIQQPKWRERNVIFNFYGDGPHKGLIERLIKLSQNKNVNLKGHFSNVEEIWKNNHLLILPSRMEGQSLALIEAMWCYRGAIVTDVGGATELIKEGETGFIAEASSNVSLERALERAWDLRADWKQIGLNAGQYIRTKYPKKSPIVVFADKIKELLQTF